MVSAGLPISRLHLVGHSIGAHLAGHIGRNIQTMTDHDLIIPRITALDPAGMLYYPEFLTKHIRASDAIFVDVIHTDVWNMGTVKPTGTVDFYPNSGWPPQPGCHSNKLHLGNCKLIEPYVVQFVFWFKEINVSKCVCRKMQSQSVLATVG